MELLKEYELKNKQKIVFNGVSLYYHPQFYREYSLYTSKNHHGSWDKNGKYLTSIYFLNQEDHEMDVILNG